MPSARKQKGNEPLLTQAARRVGLGRAFKVLGFMGAWMIVEQGLGREPTVEEYAEWWGESRATAFRHQALFRQAFPEETSPSRLVGDVADEPGLTAALRPG